MRITPSAGSPLAGANPPESTTPVYSGAGAWGRIARRVVEWIPSQPTSRSARSEDRSAKRATTPGPSRPSPTRRRPYWNGTPSATAASRRARCSAPRRMSSVASSKRPSRRPRWLRNSIAVVRVPRSATAPAMPNVSSTARPLGARLRKAPASSTGAGRPSQTTGRRPARRRSMASTGPAMPPPITRAVRPSPGSASEELADDAIEHPLERRAPQDSGVVEGGDAPLTRLEHRHERLDGVPRRPGIGLARENGSPAGMHHRDAGPQEPQGLDSAGQPGAPEPGVEQLLVRLGDRGPAGGARSVEADVF